MSHLSWEKLTFCIRLKKSTHINNRNSAQQLVLLIAFECFWGMRVQKAKLPSRPSQEGRPDAFRQSISTVVPSSPAIPATRDPWILKMEVYRLWKTTENRIRFDMHWFRQKHLKSVETWYDLMNCHLDEDDMTMIITDSSHQGLSHAELPFAFRWFVPGEASGEAYRWFQNSICWKLAEKAAKKQFQLSNLFDSITENVFVFE